MNKVVVVAFTGGEVDPYILARPDLQNYSACAGLLENAFVTSQGAMELAPGTVYIGETPSSARARLVPWTLSLNESYCLELSAEKMRFISGEAFVTVEGAAATIGSFTDESATIPTGGDPAPDGGSSGIGGPAGGDTGGLSTEGWGNENDGWAQ